MKIKAILATAAIWMIYAEQVAAQPSFISYTKLHNPDPGVGIFGDIDGTPIYSRGPGSPTVLPVDLNHDGVDDFRIVAGEGGASAWRIDGVGPNASLGRAPGPPDLNSFVLALDAGMSIGPEVTSPDQWLTTFDTEFGRISPTITAYSSIGGLGFFLDKTAYAGLPYQLGADTYYGWIKIQDIEFLQGGGCFRIRLRYSPKHADLGRRDS